MPHTKLRIKQDGGIITRFKGNSNNPKFLPSPERINEINTAKILRSKLQSTIPRNDNNDAQENRMQQQVLVQAEELAKLEKGWFKSRKDREEAKTKLRKLQQEFERKRREFERKRREALEEKAANYVDSEHQMVLNEFSTRVAEMETQYGDVPDYGHPDDEQYVVAKQENTLRTR